MTEQLRFFVDSAALDECGVVDRNHGKAEGAVAPYHESAQTMAHDGSAGGVSVQPSLRPFLLVAAKSWVAEARRRRVSGYDNGSIYWILIGMAASARHDAMLLPNTGINARSEATSR